MSDACPHTVDHEPDAIAGWYGKLPSLGDFAARRLSDAFIAPWDAWLAQRVAETQFALGADWLGLYLTCPVWRFFAMPGAIAPTLGACWTGVVMASVDRVGRHFPLTIAASLPCAPSTAGEVDALWQWLSAIEGVALAALDFDHTIERLDAQLAALPVPGLADTRAGTDTAVLGESWTVPCAAALPCTLARAVAPLWQTDLYGMSMWTSAQAARKQAEEAEEVADASSTFTISLAYGLPDTALFTTLLRDCGS
jgi:type VI secretion system protein ImpM